MLIGDNGTLYRICTLSKPTVKFDKFTLSVYVTHLVDDTGVDLEGGGVGTTAGRGYLCDAPLVHRLAEAHFST